MKKTKLLVAALTLTMLATGGAIAGCTHKHTFDTSAWGGKDETGHWHISTCEHKDEKGDFEAHDYGADGNAQYCVDCNYANPDYVAPTPETTVTLNKTELNLGIGNLEAELTATVSDGGTVTWASDNPEVVSVNEETGYVEALKPGAATITATVVGGEAHATCEVVVADGYYLIGGQDPDWNKVGVFGQSGVIYFMPTDTEGIYKTGSIELPRLGNFQIAPVGDTSGDWWQKAFNGDYIATGDEVLSKNDGGNIAVEKHGKYTITLDLTGDKAVVSGVCDQIIDEEEVEDVYYLIGSANNWSLANTVEAAGNYAFTKNDNGTYSLTATLEKGVTFKIALVGMAWNGALDTRAVAEGRIANAVSDEVQLIYASGDYNIETGVAGEYVFTITVEGNKATLDYTCTPSADDDTPQFVDGGAYLVGRGFSSTDFGLNKDYYIDPVNGLEVDLKIGDLFKIVYCKSDAPDWNTIPTYEMAEGKEEGFLNLPGSNGTVKVTGKYTITMVGEGDNVKFVFTPDASLQPDLAVYELHYYIKGAKVTDGWKETQTADYELKETAAASGVYTMTIAMEAGDEFMFYGMNKNTATGVMQSADKYIQSGQLADGVTCVTIKDSNFVTVEAGSYTFTYNSSTNKLSIEFTAAATGDATVTE